MPLFLISFHFSLCEVLFLEKIHSFTFRKGPSSLIYHYTFRAKGLYSQSKMLNENNDGLEPFLGGAPLTHRSLIIKAKPTSYALPLSIDCWFLWPAAKLAVLSKKEEGRNSHG